MGFIGTLFSRTVLLTSLSGAGLADLIVVTGAVPEAAAVSYLIVIIILSVSPPTLLTDHPSKTHAQGHFLHGLADRPSTTIDPVLSVRNPMLPPDAGGPARHLARTAADCCVPQ